MTTPTKRHVLLAAVDESPLAEAIVAQAATLARAFAGSEIHLLHAASRIAEADVTDAPFDLEGHRPFLDGLCREAVLLGGVPVIGHLLERDPAEAIVQTAASLDADLVIVGTGDRHGFDRLVFGSVAQKVVRSAACPVLVVRPKDHVAARAPDVEPPCPDCLRQQAASHGAKLWCDRHGQHHPRMHLHYEASEGFGQGSSLIRP